MISARFADIFRGNSLKNGLLTVVLEQKVVDALWELTEQDPTAGITVDLERREVRAEGITAPFELDENSRWRLLNGLDDISITLRDEDDIAAYESARPAHKPRTLRAEQPLAPIRFRPPRRPPRTPDRHDWGYAHVRTRTAPRVPFRCPNSLSL